MLVTPKNGPALDTQAVDGDGGRRGAGRAGGRRAGGFDLAFKADALWVNTSTDRVDGPAERMTATAAAVSRFRTGPKGSRDYTARRPAFTAADNERPIRARGGVGRRCATGARAATAAMPGIFLASSRNKHF